MKKLFLVLIIGFINILSYGYERFQYQGYWYEILDNNTCQLAECPTLRFEKTEKWETQYPAWNNWQATQVLVGYETKLVGERDKDALPYYNGVYGPNLRPEKDKYPKLEIPSRAFYNDIEYTVTKIGKFSFAGSDYGCGFDEILIPETVIEIGEGAFFPIESLSKLTIGENVKTIGDYAFHECRTLKSINIPNSVEYIGDHAFCHCFSACPILIGKNVRYIGDYAFYQSHYECENILELPSSLEHIGVMAFDFNRTAEGTRTKGLTDLFVHSTTPPDLSVDENDMTAFGNIDPSLHFWDINGWWVYPFVCLHVPQGSYLDYVNHPYWGKFTCIIDDLVNTTETISNTLGYVFIVPTEEIDLNAEINIDSQEGLKWETVDDNDIVEISEDGHVKGKSFGTYIAISKSNNGSQVWNGSDWVDAEPTITAAVAIFVCPTITLICDNLEEKNTQKAKALSVNEDEQEDNETTDYDNLIEDYASYQHRVVYNSYPKFQIEAPQGIKISEIDKGKFDEGYNFTEEYQNEYNSTLQEIDKEQKVGEITEDGEEYLVPLTPITENRVIKITTYIVQEGSLSGVNEVTLSHNITIKTFARTIIIEGAEDTDLVMVYNYKGQMLKQTTDKTIEFGDNGIYIVTVGDVAFKVLIP